MSFLFGSSKSTTEIPQWLKEPTERMLARSEAVGQAGYMPYMGPDVAALDPAQVGAMRNNASARAAFGLDASMPRIPDAQDFGNGTWGYSSHPLFEAAKEAHAARYPGQADYYSSFFIDPVTGMPGANTYNPVTGEPMTQPVAPQVVRETGDDPGRAANQQERDAYAAPTGSGGLFGYSGFNDMIDGGGPGQSGGQFGGLFSGPSNAVASPRGSGGGIFGGWF